jgi:hypothetical protein
MKRINFGYKIRGTAYGYDFFNFTGEAEWVWYDLTSMQMLSFEEVFEGVSEGIRDEMIFHLDLFK